jgi:hypothetical protein
VISPGAGRTGDENRLWARAVEQSRELHLRFVYSTDRPLATAVVIVRARRHAVPD